MMTAQWDADSSIRERLALLAALLEYRSINYEKLEPGWLKASVGRYCYSILDDSWTKADKGYGPVKVVVSVDAAVQLSRLYRYGIKYHEAMRLAGYDELIELVEPQDGIEPPTD
jgi:hypothetical protein